MRKLAIVFGLVILLASIGLAQFSFYLIDNFEEGSFDKARWWRFGDLKAEAVRNPKLAERDLIAESCGDYSLNLAGKTSNWYIGGIGTELGIDASRYTRFQADIYGNDEFRGKLKIELLEDDNNNFTIEQDPRNDYEPRNDDKWVAEVNLQGKGFMRVSIPFSAFRDVNPGIGSDSWDPDQKEGSGGLLKMQLVAISGEQKGKVDFKIDNLLLTY